MQMAIYSSARIRERAGRGFIGELSYKDNTGKWRKKSRSLSAMGKRAAQKELEAWREEMEREAAADAEAREQGRVIARTTVADYVGRYIETKANSVERSTLGEYQRLLEKLIAPHLGDMPISDLTPAIIEDWVSACGEGYKTQTVVKAFKLFKAAMTRAVEREELSKNPFRTVETPKAVKTKPNALTQKDANAVLTVLGAFDATPQTLAIEMALFTGMRLGEICGLRWRCVDLERMELEVSEVLGHYGTGYYVKVPKTGGSARTIAIPPALAQSLRARRAAMQTACMSAGVPFSESLFVLGGIDGSWINPQRVSHKWRDLASALEIEGTQGKRPTFHDLRHTYATLAIANGVDVKTVSSALGHSNAAMTLNTYASADPDAKRRAAQTMQRVYSDPATAEVLELGRTGTGDV